MTLELKVKLLRPGARPPVRKRDGDAAFDFFALGYHCVAPGRSVTRIETGVAIEIPPGYCMVLKDRSSYAAMGVHALGGVFDSNYRGEVIGLLVNVGDDDLTIADGERFAQGLILPVPLVRAVVVDELSNTDRGEAGFGSSGKF